MSLGLAGRLRSLTNRSLSLAVLAFARSNYATQVGSDTDSALLISIADDLLSLISFEALMVAYLCENFDDVRGVTPPVVVVETSVLIVWTMCHILADS